MSRSPLIIVLAILTVLAAVFFWRSSKEETASVPTSTGKESMPSPAESAAPVPVPAPLDTFSPMPSASPQAAARADFPAPLKESMPTAETYRAEARKDPHGIPESIQRVSDAMGAWMEVAMKDPAAGKEALSEFAKCVTEGEVQTVRQMCLINARRLERQHPSLAPEAERVESAASDELKNSVKKLGF